jgi:hypothetical protein
MPLLASHPTQVVISITLACEQGHSLLSTWCKAFKIQHIKILLQANNVIHFSTTSALEAMQTTLTWDTHASSRHLLSVNQNLSPGVVQHSITDSYCCMSLHCSAIGASVPLDMGDASLCLKFVSGSRLGDGRK